MKTLILLLSLCCVAATAAPPPLKVVPLKVEGDTVTVVRSFPAQVIAAPGADFYAWKFPDGVRAVQKKNVLTITSAPNGTHAVSVTAYTVDFFIDDKGKLVKKETQEDSGDITVVVGGIPDPKPPDPPVPPTPSGAMRVLIVFESGPDTPMTPEMFQVIYGPKVRGALRDRADKAGPDGRGWNIWDKDIDLTGASKFWQDAMKRPRASVPFIHIFHGDTPVHEGPLPKTEDEVIALITKNAGVGHAGR